MNDPLDSDFFLQYKFYLQIVAYYENIFFSKN